jgi:MerR family copper efflux transcriptional regulator
MTVMNIGTVSKLTGLNTKTIRYYEQIELIAPATRSDNGYRQYSEKGLEQLRFIQRARKTGFNIDECRQLLGLFNNSGRQSHQVKELVLEKADLVAKQIEELKLMHTCLLDLAAQCQSDNDPHCAILDRFTDQESTSSTSKKTHGEAS